MFALIRGERVVKMHSLGGASARSFGCGQNPETTKEFDKTRVMGGTGTAGRQGGKTRATHKIERNYREESCGGSARLQGEVGRRLIIKCAAAYNAERYKITCCN